MSAKQSLEIHASVSQAQLDNDQTIRFCNKKNVTNIHGILLSRISEQWHDPDLPDAVCHMCEWREAGCQIDQATEKRKHISVTRLNQKEK